MGKGSLRPKNARMSRSKFKVILVVFFDWKGIVFHEFVSRCQSVNKHMYREVVARLRDAGMQEELKCGKTGQRCCTTAIAWHTRRYSFAVIFQNFRYPLCCIHPILRT